MRHTGTRSAMEKRSGHTVYLTDELWAELDRRYYELRAASPRAPSKIAFIEQILRAGLSATAPGRATAPPRQPSGASSTRSSAPAVSASEDEAASHVSRGADPRAEPPRPEPAPMAASPSAAGRPTQRRHGALERLKQASDPGHPAPIRSAAGTPDTGDRDT